VTVPDAHHHGLVERGIVETVGTLRPVLEQPISDNGAD
jgi:hypothetical protein